MAEPIVDATFLLQKTPGKGGWTYLVIPAHPALKRNRGGWVKVNGVIDGFELKDFGLFPTKSGQLFMAVKKEIRKVIGKETGDTVRLVLYQETEDDPIAAPDDFMLCLDDEPLARANFAKFSKKDQRDVVDWVFAVQTDEKRVARIAQAIDLLVKGLKPC